MKITVYADETGTVAFEMRDPTRNLMLGTMCATCQTPFAPITIELTQGLEVDQMTIAPPKP